MLFDTDINVERSAAVGSVIGVMMQNKQVARKLGLQKVVERHVIIQFEAEKDLYVSFNQDDANGNVAAMMDIVPVLGALCAAYGTNLPVSVLKDDENIDDMVRWIVVDARLRKQLGEVLAFRTELLRELQTLSKESSQLDLNTFTLKNSAAGQAASDLSHDIEQMRQTLQTFDQKIDSLELLKGKLRAELQSLQREIAAEDEKRAEAVKATLEDAAKEQLMRQVTEYELMKAAHKREMDKIAVVTQLFEQRAQARKADRYEGAALALRIEDLEDIHQLITSRLAERGDQHTRRIRALAESKKRVGLAKAFIETLKGDVDVIKHARPGHEIPEDIRIREVPTFAPVLSAEGAAAAAAAKEEAAGGAAVPDAVSAAPAPAVAAAAAPIVLDDDDDDDI